ncbi:effector-associated constant component EACC1 [Streptomyces clavifer]|uniref:effector-associated constant component EACC1 n=1 Tax=Streptomyces clavifer TaxID=68188 RepID=UPI00367DF5D4
MRITLGVGGPAETEDLRRWMRRDPVLRSAVGQVRPTVTAPDTMSGGAAELVTVLLAPGGLTAAVAAAIVAWLQGKRGNQTVTITRPDGTQVTVTSEGVRGLTSEASGDLAHRVAELLLPPPQASPGSLADGPETGRSEELPRPPEADGRDERQPRAGTSEGRPRQTDHT